jgi:diguanylate cyclase (GGDEF)-like protein/hemerythrin-like metal-binding protein/PAS domain S-box-containing protein
MTAGLPIDLAMLVAAALVVSVLLYLIRRERRERAAREMAVAELRESESKFRFIAENSGDVIWVMDIASWHSTYVSPSVYRLRGYTGEEAMAQPVEAVMTPESLQRVKSILAEAIGRWEAGERTDAVRVVELDQPHKDGHLIATEVVATLHANAQGKLVSVLGVTRDITERKRAEQAIRQLAFHDPLTQLPNRRLLLDRLPQLISRAKREQSRLALLFIDLDRFKPINDEQGHEVGDWLLQSVAQRIQGCLRESDTAARIGGDEFVVLLPDLQADDDALAVAEKIRLALAQPFVTQDKVGLGVSSSIGVALYPDDGQTEQELLRIGDEAMYRAKKAGCNRVALGMPGADLADFDEIRSAGQSFVRLSWKLSFSSGHPKIDQQHRDLFRLTNVLLGKAAAQPDEPTQFNIAFDTLLAHVGELFACEEEVLRAHGYAQVTEHAQAHRELMAQALKLRDQSNAAPVSMAELVEFLVARLVAGHLLREDRMFFGLLADDQAAVDAE